MTSMEIFETTLQTLRNSYHDYNTPTQRGELFEACLKMYKENTTIQAMYIYHRKERIYKWRFEKRSTPKIFKEKTSDGLPYYEDKINYYAPEAEGLYFVAGTRYDPEEDKILWLLKIGRSKFIKGRMCDYNTNNPLMWRIGFLTGQDAFEAERDYQKALAKFAYAKTRGSQEWFLVTKEVYDVACKKGFKMFD